MKIRSNWSRVAVFGRADGQADMTQLAVGEGFPAILLTRLKTQKLYPRGVI